MRAADLQGQQRLSARARERWLDLTAVAAHHHGPFSDIEATLADNTSLKLCRLLYGGSAHRWSFASYQATHDDYQNAFLPTGSPVGTCEDTLDTACGLYLTDFHRLVSTTRENSQARPLS